MYKFKSNESNNAFEWSSLGDIQTGRKNLGEEMPVVAYRLFQYTLRDVMNRELGVDKTSDLIRKAGELAGREFCKNVLDKTLDFNAFIANLQKTLKDLKIGILRIEKADMEKLEFYLTVEEDLDCSGLPISDESVCDYDEGLIAGILNEYTGKAFVAREVDCWATGDRVCRFKVNLKTT
jgi:hypothetical protein